MKFTSPLDEIVALRNSCRSYDGLPLGDPERGELMDFIAALPAGPFGSAGRLEILDLDEFKSGAHKLGTYGVIRGAVTFIAGSAVPDEKGFVDFGFRLEAVILRATDLGLGTCWLGGTLTRDAFAAAVGAPEGEIVPAITPVGRYAGKRTIADRLIRWSAGSRNRKPWQELFFDRDFSRPLAPESGGAFSFALETVRRAPSASNKQPWRIVLGAGGREAHLLLQRSRGYNKLIRAADLQLVDMGIAMCHFELAMREQGVAGAWSRTGTDPCPLPERTGYIASWRSDA